MDTGRVMGREAAVVGNLYIASVLSLVLFCGMPMSRTSYMAACLLRL